LVPKTFWYGFGTRDVGQCPRRATRITPL
jgi:hypothetical protein